MATRKFKDDEVVSLIPKASGSAWVLQDMKQRHVTKLVVKGYTGYDQNYTVNAYANDKHVNTYSLRSNQLEAATTAKETYVDRLLAEMNSNASKIEGLQLSNQKISLMLDLIASINVEEINPNALTIFSKLKTSPNIAGSDREIYDLALSLIK